MPPPRISDAAEAASVARSVGTDPVSTDTVGTATHHCAATQTHGEKCILPGDLPKGVRVKVAGQGVQEGSGNYPPSRETGESASPANDDAVTKADAPLAASPTASPTTATGDTATVSDPAADPNAHAYDAASDPRVASARARVAMESIQYLVEYTSRLEQQRMHDEHAAHRHGYRDPHLHYHQQHNTAHLPMHAQALHQQVLPHFVPGGFAFGAATVPMRFAPAEAQQQQQNHYYQQHPAPGSESSPLWRHHGRSGGGSARSHRGSGR